MPDQPDDTPLTPEQETDVRRLLAGARHTGATPDPVVARLDRVLAELADEPVREATVVRLADRRRKAATMLVAAAAVIVVGIGLGQVLPRSGSEDASTAAGDAEAPGAVEAPTAESDSGEDAGGQSAEELARSKRQVLRLSSDRFARDAEALQSAPLGALGYGAQSDGVDKSKTTSESQDLSDFDGLRAAGRRDVCDPGAWGRGRFVAVIYEKTPGWVVLRQPQGNSQIVDLFLCGSESAVRSITLPSP